MPYIWDGKRYCDTETGRCLSRDEIVEYSALIGISTYEFVNAYAAIVISGMIGVEEWYALMQEEIKDEYIRQYFLGRGGSGSIGPEDYNAIGEMLARQFTFLAGFAGEIALMELSEAQIAARAQMYISSANEAFNRGYARAIGIPDGLLPQYPGDGNTQCLTNCRCVWAIDEVYEDDPATGIEIIAGWNCTWVVDPEAESCPDCLENGDKWAPLFVPNPNL